MAERSKAPEEMLRWDTENEASCPPNPEPVAFKNSHILHRWRHSRSIDEGFDDSAVTVIKADWRASNLQELWEDVRGIKTIEFGNIEHMRRTVEVAVNDDTPLKKVCQAWLDVQIELSEGFQVDARGDVVMGSLMGLDLFKDRLEFVSHKFTFDLPSFGFSETVKCSGASVDHKDRQLYRAPMMVFLDVSGRSEREIEELEFAILLLQMTTRFEQSEEEETNLSAWAILFNGLDYSFSHAMTTRNYLDQLRERLPTNEKIKIEKN
ncbi:hypothetical protein BO70DRAFT_393683 [Aspergillus heteromorphus CBS 117.55]|uniref:Uncharacterized protein n=1 Tax=Aspergillus heteromorphus CBS 117.55 TaxID=1448321 RepID=A0A317WRT9_9EURO|nr:uncharacterized protein BO70DRAFT_393683 [Aspergillus heteromorphus CBS 117.55]PWY89173.1 hypothetical protein BO70DRAFT_393683 [Aspergillus heteromorphus CBS 117.55]